MKTSKIKIKTFSRSYPFYVGSNIISRIKQILRKENIAFNKAIIVYDSNLKSREINKLKKNLDNIEIFTYKFISSEKKKNFKTVNKIIDKLLKFNFSRDDCVISVGGGITGDLSSFVASIFKRGIKFINIPTTLLAQVDASIGGKTGINHHKYGKNLIGSFYQPNIVIADINYMKTLKKKEIVCGYAEILKHSLIYGRSNFKFLQNFYKKIFGLDKKILLKTIIESCKIKKKIVEKDEKEKDLRKMLNLGHTFGHAYEAASGFKKNLNHGEGVILGIKTAILFSLNKGLLSKREFDKINNHIKELNINLKLINYFNYKDISKLISFMKNDKKNKSNKINLILLKGIGKVLTKKHYNINHIKVFFKNHLKNI